MKGLCFLFFAVFVVITAQARVERVEILSRADVLDGKPFGEAGTYEKVIGKVHFAVGARGASRGLMPRNRCA